MSQMFETDGMHQTAYDYIELIKKTLKNGGAVRYDSGDFLALDQCDRKSVIESLQNYEHGNKVLDSLRIRIQKSEMSEEDKKELIAMYKDRSELISMVTNQPEIGVITEIIEPEVIKPVQVIAHRSILDRIFEFIKIKS